MIQVGETVIAKSAFTVFLPGLNDIADALDWVFLLTPQYCLGQGLADVYTNHKMVNICTSSDIYELICQEQGNQVLAVFLPIIFVFNPKCFSIKPYGLPCATRLGAKQAGKDDASP